uniref:Phosphatidate cytidylyltransferase n=1 Tax=viral metagenome TaxID=1070528 RepID=A0A6M3JED4_9ZZZZ
MIIIPIISGLLNRAGGTDQWKWSKLVQKWWRWLMGIPIGILACISLHTYTPLFCILTYFLATNCSGYGENHIFRKWFGRDATFLIYGFLFGLASLPVLGWQAITQAIIGSASFYFLMIWSNDGYFGHKLRHCYVEMIFGFLGTIMYFLR